jgi:cell division GTPase FtsZ
MPSMCLKNAQRLSGADVEGSGDGVAAKGFGFGTGVGAAPVVIDEPGEGGALAVIEIGLV